MFHFPIYWAIFGEVENIKAVIFFKIPQQKRVLFLPNQHKIQGLIKCMPRQLEQSIPTRKWICSGKYCTSHGLKCSLREFFFRNLGGLPDNEDVFQDSCALASMMAVGQSLRSLPIDTFPLNAPRWRGILMQRNVVEHLTDCVVDPSLGQAYGALSGEFCLAGEGRRNPKL
jgi:hypothetical protein